MAARFTIQHYSSTLAHSYIVYAKSVGSCVWSSSDMTTRCRLHGKSPVSDHIPAWTLPAHAFTSLTERLFPLWEQKSTAGQEPVIHFIRAFLRLHLQQENQFIHSSICYLFLPILFSQHACLHPFLLLSIYFFIHHCFFFYCSVQTASRVPMWKSSCQRERQNRPTAFCFVLKYKKINMNVPYFDIILLFTKHFFHY